ncbi:MAG: ECF transporter S component [Burkholderiales bacterium]
MSTRSASSRRLLFLATAGILAAASTILRFLETPLPMIPGFLKIDFSNIPALLGGFALGPAAGAAILLIKNLLYLPVTQTGGIGEIADFVISLALILPAALFYKYKKSRKGAIAGMAVGSAIMSFLAGPLMNYFVLIPFYSMIFPIDQILGMAAAANPGINSLWTYIIYAVIPFNIIKCFAVCLVTGLLYKPLSPLLHKYR